MKHSRKVISVSRLKVEDATSFQRADINKAVIDESLPWEKLAIKVPADLVISSKTEDKQPIYTAKLTFLFCGDRYDRKRYIYKVSLANGEEIVIGSGERPYPVCETSEELSSGNSSSHLAEVTVTYSSAMEIAKI